MIRKVIAILLASAAPVVAEAPFLDLPIDCVLGDTCFIEDYPDIDPSSKAVDYTCGIKTREGHRGTDIVLTSHKLMDNGVNVLASADGIVEAIRDGMEDRPYSPEIAAEISGRECGNAVRIKHKNGLQTLYCHLKQGSVTVRSGDVVSRGTPLGLVGMSGQSNIPHIHITVLRGTQVLDPFAPDQNSETCGPSDTQLWREKIPYEPTGFLTAGFSNAVPSLSDVRSGAARRTLLGPKDPLVLYTYFHDAQDGDMLYFEASGPSGQVFEKSEQVKSPKRGTMRAFGRRAPEAGWEKGAYRGYARLERNGIVLAVRHADVDVP